MFCSGVVILTVVAAVLCAPPKAKNVLHPLPDGRIVGGVDANIEDYPYQLSLMIDGSHACGASIINTKWAITAAHCTDGASASELSVRTGSSLLATGGQVISVKRIHQNPGFDDFMNSDISILELEKDIQFSKGSAPIGLVSANETLAAGIEAVVTGWGLMDEDDIALPTHLKMVKVPIISKEDCMEEYSDTEVTDTMICAGVRAGGKDACQGDSGGPLVVHGKLAGIVSWGEGCAEPKKPGVYTNVAAMRDFVRKITKI